MALVLVTGSAGYVGQTVCRELARRGHEVRGLDRVPTPGLRDFLVANVADPEAAREAVRGASVVVHLAAEPNDCAFARLVGPNVVGLYNVMNAAREEGVERVVLASTLQIAWSRKGRKRPARVREARPSNHYALTKLWAEQMGEMYARCYGMSVIAVRLTWMVRNAAEAVKMRDMQRQAIYVSHRDAGRAFANAAVAPEIGKPGKAGKTRFAVVYVSGPDGATLFDLEPARRLIGYEPRDRFPEGLEFELPEA
jgi:uronate dehydrogenase